MVSFSSSLHSLGRTSPEQNFWKKEITDNRFYVLDPIDPTMMDKEDSILRVIISRMFECYAQAQDRPSAQRSAHSEKGPDLLKRFRKCYRNLDVLQKGRQLQDCYDDLEYLADLGDSSNMKRAFHELVILFLQLMFPREEGSISQFLVVQIDDADLNASNAYRIVEELRKYCVVPNVIILMASDFEQLELTVEQYFVGEFEPLHKSKGKDNTEILSHCHKMMERYLDKLIPGARQVHLPKIDDYIRTQENELVLRYIKSSQEDRSDSEKAPPAEDYQDFLLKMIYEKTRLILIKPERYLHNLLPKTMRELTHLLAFLVDLESISEKDGVFSKVISAWQNRQEKRNPSSDESEPAALSRDCEEALALRRENINAFMGYLRHCWVKAALNERQQAAVLPAMDAITDLKIKQLFIKLNEYGADKYQDWGPVPERPNPQYTDVVETLNKLKRRPAGAEDFGIIYISATILTLCMHLLAIQDLAHGAELGSAIPHQQKDTRSKSKTGPRDGLVPVRNLDRQLPRHHGRGVSDRAERAGHPDNYGEPEKDAGSWNRRHISCGPGHGQPRLRGRVVERRKGRPPKRTGQRIWSTQKYERPQRNPVRPKRGSCLEYGPYSQFADPLWYYPFQPG